LSVITGEVVAIEVVRTLVGSIGLVASVPITTALAVLVVADRHTGQRPPTRRDWRPRGAKPRPKDAASWDDFAPDEH
jgi:YibE/F-like protein